MRTTKVKPLISADEIEKKVTQLALRISADYDGRELVLVGVLKGAYVFMSDLSRKLTIPVFCDFLGVSSYAGKTSSSGEVKIVSDISIPVEGKDVLIVEDIVDTGLTLNYIKDILARRGPRSVKTCVLLDKKSRRVADADLDYSGFSIPDKFVVGYGLDFNGQYRSLPYIGFIEPE